MSFGPQPISKHVCHQGDYEKYGCPVCKTGEKNGFPLISISRCVLFSCENCGVAYLVCPNNLERVPRSLLDYEKMKIPVHPLSLKHV